jgi:hypothetical protein
MKTSELIVSGVIIFLLYKLYKNTQPENLNKDKFKNLPILDFPPFTTTTPVYWNKTQVIPTPASVLNPEQLKFYNASIKGISNKYVC